MKLRIPATPSPRSLLAVATSNVQTRFLSQSDAHSRLQAVRTAIAYLKARVHEFATKDRMLAEQYKKDLSGWLAAEVELLKKLGQPLDETA